MHTGRRGGDGDTAGDTPGTTGAAHGAAGGAPRWAWWTIAVGGVLALVSPALPPVPEAVLRELALTAALVAAAAGLAGNRPQARGAWRMLVAAFAAALVSQAVWDVTDLRVAGGTSGSNVGTIVAGALAFAAYVAILASVVYLATRGGDRLVRRARLLDAAVVGTATAFVLWYLGAESAYEAGGHDIELVLGSIYLVLAAAVAAAAVPLLRRRVAGRPSSTLMGVAIVLMTGSAGLFLLGRAGYEPVPWPALLPFAALTGALATLHPSMTEVGAGAALPEDDRLTSRRLLLYGTALVVPAAVVAVGSVVMSDSRQVSPIEICLYLLVIGALVHQRLHLMVVTNQRAEERLRQYFSVPMVGIVITDADRLPVEVNDEFCHMLGWSREEIFAMTSTDVTHPDDVGVDDEQYDDLVAGRIDSYVVEKRYVTRRGDVLFARHSKKAVRNPDGTLDFVIGLVDDVTDRRESDMRYRAVVESAGDGIITVDRNGTILSFNRAAEAMTGYPVEDALGKPSSMLISPKLHPQMRERILRSLDAGRSGSEPVLVDARRRDGSTFPCEITLSRVPLPRGEVFMGIARDVSDRQRLEEQLTHQALHDPLTGLANRALLHDRLGSALRRSERSGSFPAVLFVDLDRFKVINDSLGHDVGDELLIVVAHRLTAELRAADTAARLGGDEFVVLCEDLDEAAATALAARLLEVLSRPIELHRSETVVTASIGLVMAAPGASAEDLLRDADASMYRAKADGRNRFHVFDDSIRDAAVTRMTIESGLRRALAEGELRLWFQPEFAVSNLRVVGAEALLRWEHPTEGMVAPDHFLDIAEEVGLEMAIDRWVLGEATRQAQEWIAVNPDFVVWVNVSARTLVDEGLPDMVLAALARAGVPASNLGIEVTERALVRDLDLAARSLRTLREAGVRMAIDDFGTGFSSLSWLERLPLDMLKVDRSFTSGLGATRDDTVIVRSVVAMAHSLGLAAMAEGVETRHQLEHLRQLGCDHFQGFLAARPMPPELLDPSGTADVPGLPVAAIG